MRTAIDANVFSAIWTGESSVPRLLLMLEKAMQEGALLISPFVFAELHAYPGMTEALVCNFLETTGVTVDLRIEERVWSTAGVRFARYAGRRRKATGEGPRRILVDFLIGAHALLQADRLLTLDAKVYRQDFPEIVLMEVN
jgi:predicted nucleic acid-binding protein